MEPVRVLVFVDQHVVEPPADIRREHRITERLRPVEQQVVVVEHVLGLLGLDIGREELPQLSGPAGAPGKDRAQDFVERHLGVHAARVDGKAGALGGKPALHLRQTELVPDEVHQVGRILAVVDRERGVDPDLLGILAQQPRADGVERARPSQRVRHDAGILPEHLRADPRHAPASFRPPPAARRSSGESGADRRR